MKISNVEPVHETAETTHHNLMVWSAPAVATTSPPPAFLAHLAHQMASECPCSASGFAGGAFGAGGSVDESGAGSPTSDKMYVALCRRGRLSFGQRVAHR